ncbi:MAG: hypothetical protein RXR20_16340 [Paraburkholderia sp.]|jgi:hypothetical protein|uniref:hypothetical protein n=1 Tax=Burkholderiaceae TaxID=119060 RepID=UPI0010F496BA|nr:hypothetical protein [Burkholderia sp. 4M9327F10]
MTTLQTALDRDSETENQNGPVKFGAQCKIIRLSIYFIAQLSTRNACGVKACDFYAGFSRAALPERTARLHQFFASVNRRQPNVN